jgi:hypothetical protein
MELRGSRKRGELHNGQTVRFSRITLFHHSVTLRLPATLPTDGADCTDLLPQTPRPAFSKIVQKLYTTFRQLPLLPPSSDCFQTKLVFSIEALSTYKVPYSIPAVCKQGTRSTTSLYWRHTKTRSSTVSQ